MLEPMRRDSSKCLKYSAERKREEGQVQTQRWEQQWLDLGNSHSGARIGAQESYTNNCFIDRGSRLCQGTTEVMP
jgi:hypothetical protein